MPIATIVDQAVSIELVKLILGGGVLFGLGWGLGNSSAKPRTDLQGWLTDGVVGSGLGFGLGVVAAVSVSLIGAVAS